MLSRLSCMLCIFCMQQIAATAHACLQLRGICIQIPCHLTYTSPRCCLWSSLCKRQGMYGSTAWVRRCTSAEAPRYRLFTLEVAPSVHVRGRCSHMHMRSPKTMQSAIPVTGQLSSGAQSPRGSERNCVTSATRYEVEQQQHNRESYKKNPPGCHWPGVCEM